MNQDAIISRPAELEDGTPLERRLPPGGGIVIALVMSLGAYAVGWWVLSMRIGMVTITTSSTTQAAPTTPQRRRRATSRGQ